MQSQLTRFGGGNRLGYGYGDATRALSLYNQNSMNWTQVKPVNYDQMSADAQAVFNRYGTSYRFGQLYEAGAKLDLTRGLALSAGLEGAVIYPRWVFWPWLGSVAIYSAVQGSVEYFAMRVIKSSPKLGPIMYFLLKSGVSLGYYLLSSEQMNWPFNSETPLTVSSVKLGASLSF